jgi:hypothetical protein
MACIPAAAGAAGFFWQPVAANPARTIKPNPKMRFKAVFLTRFFSCPGLIGLELRFVPDGLP